MTTKIQVKEAIEFDLPSTYITFDFHFGVDMLLKEKVVNIIDKKLTSLLLNEHEDANLKEVVIESITSELLLSVHNFYCANFDYSKLVDRDTIRMNYDERLSHSAILESVVPEGFLVRIQLNELNDTFQKYEAIAYSDVFFSQPVGLNEKSFLFTADDIFNVKGAITKKVIYLNAFEIAVVKTLRKFVNFDIELDDTEKLIDDINDVFKYEIFSIESEK